MIGTAANTLAAGNHNHTGVYQPIDSDLTALAGLDVIERSSGTSVNGRKKISKNNK